jgi:phosphatidylglycerophosphate synthase
MEVNSAAKSLNFFYLLKLQQILPSLLTSLRVIILPHIFLFFNQGFTLAVYALFITAIGTDFLDGFLARKLKVTSNYGAYFDIIVDFIFIVSFFGFFINSGIYSNWILILISVTFFQFIISNLFLKRTIYDPVGKIYGSLLFAGIGITLLFDSQIAHNFVTYGILTSTLASIICRIVYLLAKRKKGLQIFESIWIGARNQT